MKTREMLAEKAHREIMACIGCNDCLLACPLPQVKMITISELNYAVAEETITNQRVIDFAHACTQCQQCVPACPADLSRADMVLFNKLKVEDTAPDQVVTMQFGEQVLPSQWTLDQLTDFLSQMPLFAGVKPMELRRLILRSTLRKLSEKEVLCREGTYHERLFIVLDGAVEQTVSQAASGRAKILVLGPGTFHGEMAVIADQMEQFTVAAIESALVLEVPKATLYHLIELSQSLRETMDELYRRRAIWTYAKKSPVLGVFPDDVLQDLVHGTQLIVYESGEVVGRQGQEVNDVFLVRSGFLRVGQEKQGIRERVLVYFREGDTFGGPESIRGERALPFSVKANTRSELIRFSEKHILKALQKHPRLRDEFARQLRAVDALGKSKPEKVDKARRAPAKENTTQMDLSWTSLLDKGVLQGHEVLAIDQSICTNCNNCVDACGRRHGLTRLERSGLQLGPILFPTACRHCEDPVCLLCSVNGIVRLPDGEIKIVTDNCIGCGACADRCPYDNIKMHELADKIPKRPFLLQIIEDVTKISFPGSNVEAGHGDKQKVAVKCDLCAGYDDYACVTACPVGAAVRINPVETFGRTDLIIGLEMSKERD